MLTSTTSTSITIRTHCYKQTLPRRLLPAPAANLTVSAAANNANGGPVPLRNGCSKIQSRCGESDDPSAKMQKRPDESRGLARKRRWFLGLARPTAVFVTMGVQRFRLRPLRAGDRARFSERQGLGGAAARPGRSVRTERARVGAR